MANKGSRLNGAAHALLIMLGMGLGIMLLVSVLQRFVDPHITVSRRDGGQQAPVVGSSSQVGALMQDVARDPQNREKLVRLIESLMAVGSWDAAESFAQRAVTLDLRDAQALYLLGVIKHNQGKHAEAAELLEKVLELQDSASVRYSLGVLYIHYLGKAARGVEHLTAGLHDPNVGDDLRRGIREELEKAPLPGAETRPAARAKPDAGDAARGAARP